MSRELDLYAKVEDLLGIEEATAFLHANYTHTLQEYKATNVLDIGCGRGDLLESLAEVNIKAKGIDKSAIMAEDAASKGLDVTCRELCDVDETFDAAVAVFDVLNFLDATELKTFLECVVNTLDEDGVFIADVNTKHGFEEVADGTMSAQDETRFLSVDAAYYDEKLDTTFSLFSKREDGLYTKEQETITQHFHPTKVFKKVPNLKLIKTEKISLYDSDDKLLLIFKKESK